MDELRVGVESAQVESGSHNQRPRRLPPEQSLAFQVRRAHLAFSRLLESRLARHRLKVGYWYYLRALGMKDCVTQRHLSDATNVTETTTVALLRGMAHDGLILRTKDTVDRRQTIVSLTPHGREIEQLISPYASQLNRIATTGIRQQDLDICFAVLSRMSENLEVAIESTGDEVGD
ncbi:MarR family winged helix-turn-helix transcriptional regulator [Sphingosinicella soli]|uniref:DNA-binding MarR family transcriptional regulator n=1 Tax=Sphingosinicella soli TaxID=333708 RepID=A0A7W7B3S2_9SPHN|nr:MarR family winged helix-turn-helix transcriptional regulator [Sphingosinicella soli]MBB4633374.1 DNA-binding MarR family transcriptional regulator [Sphingosinicella soli]